MKSGLGGELGVRLWESVEPCILNSIFEKTSRFEWIPVENNRLSVLYFFALPRGKDADMSQSNMSQSTPLLLLGHGTRDADGRQRFLEFAHRFQDYDSSRPVVPCFLELTDPLVQAGIDHCVEQGYQTLTVLPVLLFAARHSKFDVTNELDRASQRHPQLTLNYGRHLGVSLRWLDLWQQRLALADQQSAVPRSKTVLLFVGRGSSDPDANGDVFKLARMLWEGSDYQDLEVCFTGITHPRLERGFERARAWQPERIIVIPHLLFDGVLAKRILTVVHQEQADHPDVEVQALSVIGADPILFELIRDREQEAQAGQVSHETATPASFAKPSVPKATTIITTIIIILSLITTVIITMPTASLIPNRRCMASMPILKGKPCTTAFQTSIPRLMTITSGPGKFLNLDSNQFSPR